MAITSAERSILSQARAIILRESCERQDELNRLEEARDWASSIANNSQDASEAQSASTACSLIDASLQSLILSDSFAQGAIDHIEAMIGVRD